VHELRRIRRELDFRKLGDTKTEGANKMEDTSHKLMLLQAQRQEIERLIATDPHNEQFLKMRDDMDKVIALTQQLAAISQTGGSSSSIGGGAGNEASSERNTHGDDSDDDGEDGNLSDLDSEDEDGAGVNKVSGSAPSNAAFKVGSVVEVVGSDRPYPGVVTGVLEDGTFRVKYYEFDAEVTLPLSNLAPIRKSMVKPAEVEVGFKGQCIYPVDQLFYDAQVTSITEHGVVVLFSQYGNSCEVPINYLKPLLQKVKKAADPNALIKIPENLKILPTDTEEVCHLHFILCCRRYLSCVVLQEKQRKKKRIKAIKSKNRIVTIEAEASAVATGWKKFVNKVLKI
jgi:survival-of-motor-neuron-related-splicing factor 30